MANGKNGSSFKNSKNNMGSDFVKYTAPKSNARAPEQDTSEKAFLNKMFSEDFNKFTKEKQKEEEKLKLAGGKDSAKKTSTNKKSLQKDSSKDTTKNSTASEQEQKNKKAGWLKRTLDLAKDLIGDFKNKFSGQKLGQADVANLAKLMVKNPSAFEKMKDNNVSIDFDMLEKLRSTSEKDAFKMLDTLVKEKDMKINITSSTGTRCPFNSLKNVTLTESAIVRAKIPGPIVGDGSVGEDNNLDLPSDKNTNFNNDEDFNNLNSGCNTPSDVTSGQDESEENKSGSSGEQGKLGAATGIEGFAISGSSENKLRKIYIVRAVPKKKENENIKRSVDANNLPNPPNPLDEVELKREGDLIKLPDGKLIANVNGIDSRLDINNSDLKNKIIQNSPQNPNDPKASKNLVEAIKKDIENNPDLVGTTVPSSTIPQSINGTKKISASDVMITLLGSWLREPTPEEGKIVYYQDIFLSGETALDIVKKLKKINKQIDFTEGF